MRKKDKNKTDYDEVILPKEQVLEGAFPTELVWLLYGQPGIGKTTFASKMDSPLFLYTDPGQRFVKVFKRPITDWLVFKRYVKVLGDETPNRYSTIVVDTVDLLFNMCQQYIYRKRGIEHASDEEWGKGWEMISNEFAVAVSKLCLLPYGVVFISHMKEIEVRGRLTKTSKLVPSLAKAGMRAVAPLTDIIAFCGFDKDSADHDDAIRLIKFSPAETVEAKDRTGLLPASCELDFGTVSSYLPNRAGEVSAKRTDEGQRTTRPKKKKKKGDRG